MVELRHDDRHEDSGTNVLIRLSTIGPLPFLFANAPVDENGAACTAAVIGPGCGDGRRARVSWQTRETEGRAGVSDMGIRKTFARDARAGDRDRMVVVYRGNYKARGRLELRGE